jgi:hypothetical protein
MSQDTDITESSWPAAFAVAPRPIREWSNTELARRVDFMLSEAAKKLGIPYDAGLHFETLARDIVVAAQGGDRLLPAEYRTVWQIWSIFRRHTHG